MKTSLNAENLALMLALNELLKKLDELEQDDQLLASLLKEEAMNQILNLPTAEYLLRLSNNPESKKALDISQLDFEQIFGCALVWCGSRPAVKWNLTGRVEPVHNWATARTIQNDSMNLLDRYLKGE